MKSLCLGVIVTGIALSGCMSTAQSKVGIGIGALGVAVGTTMSILSASDGEAELAVAGSIISLLGSGAFFTGLGSLGPNQRIDRLELSGRLFESEQSVESTNAVTTPIVQPASPSPPTYVSQPPSTATATMSDICWTHFAELDQLEQNFLLRERRDFEGTENEPYRMITTLTACPEGYTSVRQLTLGWQVCHNPSLMPENEPCTSEE